MPVSMIPALNRINRDTTKAAGARYTPSTDAEAPNLQIKSLLDAIEALGLSDTYRDGVDSLTSTLAEAWNGRTPKLGKLFESRHRTPDLLIRLLLILRNSIESLIAI